VPSPAVVGRANKTLPAAERDEAARAACRARLHTRPAEACVVVDECGGAQRRCAPAARPALRAPRVPGERYPPRGAGDHHHHRVTPSPGDGTDHGAARSSGRARLRGLYRIIYSKTIFQHPGKEQRPATAHAGVGFVEGACVSSLVLGFRTPQTPPSPLVGEAHRGRFFGKPLRTISRFRHQNAQTPPSPLVGEGGWGDEGQKCTGMQKTAYLSQELHP
jgi:hypothetical protein